MTTFIKKYRISGLTLGLIFGLVAFISVGCVITADPGNGPNNNTPVEAEPQAIDPDSPVSSDDPTPTPTSPAALPEGEVRYGLAPVDNIDILIMESFPVQVRVVITGNLPDGCTRLDQTEVTRTENTFQVELTTRRPVDVACTEALVPYQENVPLDVVGLPAGEYTVEVNGVTGTFTLDIDNILE